MPQQAPIPFAPAQETGHEEIAGAAQPSFNVVVDSSGAVSRRPGIEAYDLGGEGLSSNPIVGLHVTSGDDIFAFAGDLPGDLEIYKLTDGAGVDLTSPPGRAMTGTTRPVFAETEAMLVFASSRGMYRILLDSLAPEALPGSTNVPSHVVAHGSRILANDLKSGKSQVYYSAPSLGSSTAGHEQWGVQITDIGSSGYFTAEAKPDPVLAVAENSNEVFVFGSTSLQTYGPDANLVYASVATRDFGIGAPHSIVRDDQSFAWIDDRRRVVHSNGRAVTVLSDPIQADLDDMIRVDDAFGYRVHLGPTKVLVWHFPTDGRTYAFQSGIGWSQWSGWSNGNWSPFIVTACAHRYGKGDNVCGTKDGDIGVLRSHVATDLGAEVPAHITTGFLDRQTDLRKHCRSIRLILRRGVSGTSDAYALLQWRDDLGPWGSPLKVDLGKTGDTRINVEFRSLGVYRRRQWRFSFHGSEPFTLAKATEEYDTLGN